MTELAVLVAAVALGLLVGWVLRIVWARIGEARADAHLRRLLAPRIASWRTDYTSQGGGR
jgi:hypothetical protein